MALHKRDIIRGLTKLGFIDDNRRKHEGYLLEINGRVVAQTMVSRSWDTVTDSMTGNIARQIGTSRQKFVDTCRCTRGREAYLADLDLGSS